MTTATQIPVDLITRPGVYQMNADAYHADPVAGGSLSRSGATKLLPPSCPALFRYDQDHAETASKVFDYGSAAHMLVLGAGPEIVIVEADNWRHKVDQEAAKDARAAGRIPLLPKEAEPMYAMAAALKAHPIAGPMFAPGTGRAEQSLIWPDQVTGVWCRSRLDWLPYADPSTGRLIIPEYKTAATASPTELPRPAHQYGYHIQAWWYEEAVRALGLSPAPQLAFVFQEKTPPYLVSVMCPTDTMRNLGGLLGRRAMATFAECMASGVWPGYSDEVEWLPLPGWVEAQWGDQIR